MKLRKVFFICILAIISLGMIIPINASAHAYLQNSNPKDQSHIQKAPKQVRLVFDEMIQADFPSIQVTGSDGKKVSVGKTRVSKENDHVVEVGLKSNLKPDVYTASWRVVSADGHPVQGQIAFKLGKTDQAFQQADTGSNTSQTVVSSLQKIILYIGFSLFAGTLLFAFWIFRKEEKMPGEVRRAWHRLHIGAWLFTGAALLLNIPIQLLIIAGQLDWRSAQEIFWNNATGHLLLIQLVLWALLGGAVYVQKMRKRYLVMILEAILLTGLLITKAMMGHSAAASDKVVAIAANFLHLAAASSWVGLMIVMLIALWKYPAKKEKWERFSPIGVIGVAGILMSGLLLAVMDLGGIGNLFHTTYGLLIVIKIGLFLLMGGIGLAHYLLIHMANKQLPLKTIIVEYGIGIAVLIVAGFLTNTQTPPPAAPEAFNQTIVAKASTTKINLQVLPKVVGENQFVVSFLKNDGSTRTDFQQVSLTAVNKKTKQQVTFQAKREKSFYTASGLYLNQTGNWEIKVHALTKDFQNVDQTFTFSITQ